MTEAEIKAQNIYISKLQRENEVMKMLGNKEGFYQYYFKQVEKFKTNYDAFEYVNELHRELFGEYRYANYETFKRMLSYKQNKK